MSETSARCPFRFRTETWIAVLLFAVTLSLFWPARGFDYVNLDDYHYVADNPAVAGGVRWPAVREAFTTVREQWWLPLLWISYMADVDAFGPGPHGHHLVNVLLHAANAALLFWVLFRMTGSRWRSFFVAALFAWHPTRVEAVAWIAARKDTLSGLFFMLALLAYVRHAERPSARRMGLVFLLLLAGLMSKSVLVAVPFLLLALDAWPLRRAKTLWGADAWREWKPLLREKAPLLALAVAFVAINVRTHVSGIGADGLVSPATRLGLIAPNVFAYLGKIAAPIRLNVVYPEHDVVFWPLSVAAALALLAALAAAIRLRETRPYLLTGGLWFLLMLAPVVRGVRLGLAQYADRWSYLPLIGAGLALAWAGADLQERRRRLKTPVLAAGGLVLLACLARTPAQLGWWRNSLLLFQRAAFLAPESHTARNSLGQALCEAGQTAAGAEHLRAALGMQPDNPEYHSNLGVAMLGLGRAEEALALHDEAIRLKPAAPFPYNNRGNALAALGRSREAEAAYLEALRLQPEYAEAHFNLGNLLFQSNRAPEALAHYRAAARLRPEKALNWCNLGVAYAQLGRYAEAAPCVERALRIDPDLPAARTAAMRLKAMGY